MRLRPLLAVTSVGMVLVAGLLTPTATTHAAFSDTATVSASSTTTFTVPAPAVSCSGGGSQVTLAFAAAPEPGAGGGFLNYSATAAPAPAPGVGGSGVSRTVVLNASNYAGLVIIGGGVDVIVTARLGATNFTNTTTTRVGVLSLAGITRLSCP